VRRWDVNPKSVPIHRQLPEPTSILCIELYGPSSVVPLANDNFADALPIVPDQLVQTATADATSEFFEPAHAGGRVCRGRDPGDRRGGVAHKAPARG
jgi:hypothetical protein